MKKRRIIISASVIAGLSLSFAILYPIIVQDFKWKTSFIFLLGAILNVVAMGIIIKSQLKNN